MADTSRASHCSDRGQVGTSRVHTRDGSDSQRWSVDRRLGSGESPLAPGMDSSRPLCEAGPDFPFPFPFPAGQFVRIITDQSGPQHHPESIIRETSRTDSPARASFSGSIGVFASQELDVVVTSLTLVPSIRQEQLRRLPASAVRAL
ncbi:MAG: hypothetical protein J07HR59_00625 [Halorubrum sp. J07HR59]|nr:MAG: hypothetical protein J07HR59_00625 [Halorubrum sp. J07HR59]